jgi:pimeloyl-ACP methyl ester carboxylesterase
VFELAVVRHRTSGTAEQRIGSLFYNPGGPGGSGLDTIAQGWEALPQDVKETFDLVSWDPRGVGQTKPDVKCDTGRMTLPITGSVDWAAAYEQMRSSTARANAACLKANPELLPYVGTKNVVRDLDALRAAVGDTRLTYWGMSYGTRIGYVYALTYPDRVRELVFDGPVNPNGTLKEFAATYAVSADSALGLFFQLHPDTRATFDRSLAKLEAAPLKLPSGATFSRWTLLQYLEQVARSEASWPGLGRLLGILDRALTGAPSDSDAAKGLLEQVLNASPKSHVIDGAPPVVSAIDCIDYADRPSAKAQDSTGRLIRRQAPIAGWMNYVVLATQCSGLELSSDPVPTSFAPVDGSRILISASTRDAATAYAWAVSMARAFDGARMLTYVGGQHVNYAVLGSPCVNDIVSAFLINGTVPANDVACPNVGRQQN